MVTDTEAYEEGYDAYYSNASFDGSPYASGVRRTAWEAGWLDAQEEEDKPHERPTKPQD